MVMAGITSLSSSRHTLQYQPSLVDGDAVSAAVDAQFPASTPLSVAGLLSQHPSQRTALIWPGPTPKHGHVVWNTATYSDLAHAVARLPVSLAPLLPATALDCGLTGFRVATRIADPAVSAVSTLALAGWACVAPVSPEATWHELLAESREAGCSAVFLGGSESPLDADWPSDKDWKASGILFVASLALERGQDGLHLALKPLWRSTDVPAGHPDAEQLASSLKPATRDDVVLILRTSGSTGAKKVVPYTLQHLVVGAFLCAESWQITELDRCINVMPLFHVGGIVRNLFSPLVSGGSTILLPRFHSPTFWAAIALGATWYYAGPALHKSILDSKPEGLETKLRMVANASGPLTEELAARIQAVLGSSETKLVVLPSYGMTECLPISTPPPDYSLASHPRSSGLPCGPRVSIFPYDSLTAAPPRTEGRICVAGPPMFDGYEPPATHKWPGPPAPLDKSTFLDAPGGPWFDTGDLGFLDEEGYLYVTGRGKEVVNRGGETLSPVEIEESCSAALQKAGYSISGLLCFAVPDSRLGEVPGLIIAQPANSRRPGLKQLHAALEGEVHPAKWPSWICYATEVPRNALGKVVRVGTAAKAFPTASLTVDVEQLAGSVKNTEWNGATGKAGNVARRAEVVEEAIAAADFDVKRVRVVDVALGGVTPSGQLPADHCIAAVWCVSGKADKHALLAAVEATVHGYEVPAALVVLDSSDPEAIAAEDLPESQLLRFLQNYEKSHVSLTTKKVALILSAILPNKPTLVPESDFFAEGGDSIMAGLAASKLRKQFGVKMDVAGVFRARTVAAIADDIEGKMLASGKPLLIREDSYGNEDELDGDLESGLAGANGHADERAPLLGSRRRRSSVSTRGPSSTHPVTVFIQMLPAFFIVPLFAWARYLLWIALLAGSCILAGRTRMAILEVLASLIAARITWDLVRPFIGIGFKWIVMWKHREGLHRVWGWTYLRWWLTRRVLEITGKGCFGWYDGGVRHYHMLLGAKIGKGTKISKRATFSEHDLITIGENVLIDAPCTISPFAFHSTSPGRMAFSPIEIGDDCTFAPRTVVVSGHKLPAGTCMGPATSSHFLEDAHPSNRAYCRESFAGPAWYLKFFVGGPILLLSRLLSWLPWIAYALMLTFIPWFAAGRPDARSVPQLLAWFASSKRLVLYFGFLIPARTLIPPFLQLGYSLLIKWLVVGRFKPGPRDTSEWGKFRHYLMKSLDIGGSFHGITHLVGTHYSTVARLFRLFGAKVGERVYWPGSGLLGLYEFDLWEVGNDAVFGSRTVVMPFDADEGKTIKIGDGAMVADRCVLLPGLELEPGSCLGSGGVGTKELVLPPGSRAVGSVRGYPVILGGDATSEKAPTENGKANTGTTGTEFLRPFGKAFYFRQAVGYFVWPELFHALWGIFVHTVFAMLRRAPLFMALKAGVRLARLASLSGIGTMSSATTIAGPSLASLNGLVNLFWLGDLPMDPFTNDEPTILPWPADPNPTRSEPPDETLILWFLLAFMVIKPLFTVLFMCIDILSKWAIMGTRKAGKYPWDSSNYCQRWNIYLVLSGAAKRVAGAGGGNILTLLGGTAFMPAYFRALGATIGRDVCLYPNFADPPMTEPDIVTIGDGALIDDCSLIGHLNPMGNFSLHPVTIARNSIVKKGARVMAGAGTEEGAVVEELSLVMSGEMVSAGERWVGWPPRN